VLVGAGGLGLPPGPARPLIRIDAGMSADETARAHRESLGRLMFGDPARVDDLAVLVQEENLRRARFRSGAIPVSDVLRRALPAIRARIGGIWGGRDAFAGPDLTGYREALASVSPALDLRVIAGAGHWVIYEAAAEVNAALREML
jgi:pimeloyl-ACP methyl ester carboxylesterase